MKGIYSTFLILFCFFSAFSQSYSNPYPNNTVKVEVTERKTLGQTLNEQQKNLSDGIRQNAQLRASMEANRSAALANNSTTIKTDYLINNDGAYKAIVIDNVSGWMVSGNRNTLIKTLRASEKYRFYKSIKDVPEVLRNSDKILFLNWIREAPTDYDRISTIIVKNNKRETVYEAIHKNKSYSEILSPLIQNYAMSSDELEAKSELLRSEAISKIKELKELLDMGIITQDEFDKEAVTLKKIILSN